MRASWSQGCASSSQGRTDRSQMHACCSQRHARCREGVPAGSWSASPCDWRVCAKPCALRPASQHRSAWCCSRRTPCRGCRRPCCPWKRQARVKLRNAMAVMSNRSMSSSVPVPLRAPDCNPPGSSRAIPANAGIPQEMPIRTRGTAATSDGAESSVECRVQQFCIGATFDADFNAKAARCGSIRRVSGRIRHRGWKLPISRRRP
ncbi:MAG: hypothetical protein FAZ92_01290 [Accumulibacter sp.]|nr:MAG: hypothetical protein FAZ92_01290 [Accumulibacter sp.]